jgi:hypothetical protein
METQPDPLLSFLPLFLVGVIFSIPAYFLAKEKGRSPLKWVLLCFIPFANIFFIYYFIATPNTRLEKKIDALLEAQGIHTTSE